jgi:hypothetical protein
MAKIRLISQLQLEGFADTVRDADEGSSDAPLSVAEIQRRSMAARQALEAARDHEEGAIIADVPEWYEQYHRLINAHLPWRVAAYVAWATMPRQMRWPKTQDELATQVLGLGSDRVIAEWRKKYPIDQMIADLQAEALMTYRPGAFHALGTMANQMSYRAAPDRKLFFEMTHDYTPRQKMIEVESSAAIEDLSALSDAELETMSGETAKSMLLRMHAELDEDEPADKPASAEAGADEQ